MPVRNVGSGYKCGHAKNVYKHNPKSKLSKRVAMRKAKRQCVAIHIAKAKRARKL